MTGAGFGAGGWGAGPWGGAEQFLADEACDLFLFDDDNMSGILTSLFVEATGDPTQFELSYPTPPGTSEDLGILSGDSGDAGFATNNAYLTAFAAFDNEYTVEATFTFEELPNDFSNVVTRHVMLGVTDTTGPCAAIFISKVGLAYAGAVHHNPATPDVNGNLVLDSTFQVIPATAVYAPLGVPMTYRVAVSNVVGAVYLFATPTADLTTTGHQLVAVLPTIDASDLTFAPPADRAYISVRGTTAQPSRVALDRWCLSSFFDVPNVAPVANAGQDQAVRACSIALLDGSASFDPEGAPLLYQWRLIDAPTDSDFASGGADGVTYSIAPFTGFTNRFHSTTLAAIEPLDPILLGDVLLVDGVARTIVGKATDGNGFHVQTIVADIPDNLVNSQFKLVRQRGLSTPTAVTTSFFPDVPGFYKLDLTVFDGSLYSPPAVVILNVLESVLPRGCVPDANFIFDYIGDFWKLVEDAEALGVVWSGLSQVAATELYTLWQYEYSKSLRDVQRTLIRRWLHYDLLLAEPIPELTTIRAIWSGVQSTNVPVVGDPGVVGTSLVLNTSLSSEQLVLDWVYATTAQQAADELLNRLREFDSRFSVTVIPDRTGTFLVIRIDAPFVFDVDDSTTSPIFVGGVSNTTLEGSGAAGGGARTYVLDKSLTGKDIREDDLLVLDGIGYRITRVISGTAFDPDAFDQQRVTLKDNLPVPAPTSWRIASTVKSELLNFYNGMVSDGDHVYLEVTDAEGTESELVECRAYGAAAQRVNYLPFDATPLGDALADADKTVYLAKCVRRNYVPISPLVVDLPALQEHVVIEDDEATLRRNVDFFLEDYRGAAAVRFVADVDGGPDIWEGLVPPDRLWAEYTYIDNNPGIEANFGIPAEFTLDDLAGLSGDVDYLSAVRGLWYAFFNGPKPDNIRVGAQIFLALPFAQEAGIIEEIRTDFSPSNGRILVRDEANQEIVRAYTYPAVLELEINPNTGQRYAVGDAVAQFAPLVEGVEVIDYIKNPTWFSGIQTQGVFQEVQKYHSYSIRVDSDVFDLSALLLVRNFVLTIKPTYTYPVIIVELNVGDTDIDVIDQITYRGRLILNDNTCEFLGSGMYDDGIPGPEGQYWNQFDNDETTPAPTYPTADSDIKWGFDKEFICPSDSLVLNLIAVQAVSGPATFDSFLQYDGVLNQGFQYSIVGPVVVPANPAELNLPNTVPNAAIHDGDITTIRLLIAGSGPGAFDTDYELVVRVNGAEQHVEAFDASDPVIEVNVTTSIAILTADVVTFHVRVPAASPSPGARSPDWTLLSGLVVHQNGVWSFGDIIPAGTYYISIPL